MSPSSPGFRRRQPEQERSEDAHPVGAVLGDLLAGGPWRAGLALAALARAWEDVVGERLGRECSPVRLEEGVLTVRVSTGPWAAQLRFLGQDVRRRANLTLGSEAVREVRVVVDRGPRGSGPGGPTSGPGW